MKYKKSYFILLIVLIMYYVFWVYQYNFCTIHVHLIETIVLFIPIVLILLIGVIKTKFKIRTLIVVIDIIIFIVIFLIINFFTLVSVVLEEGISSEKDPNRYNYIYNIAGYKNYTYQFPSEISNDISCDNKTKFYYSPQFIQGGFNLELLMPMSKNDMKKYISKYEDKVKKKIEIKNDDGEYGEYGIVKPYNLLEYDESREFFDECNIYILESESYKPNNWNHGYVAYIAENEKLEELLLVTQVW